MSNTQRERERKYLEMKLLDEARQNTEVLNIIGAVLSVQPGSSCSSRCSLARSGLSSRS